VAHFHIAHEASFDLPTLSHFPTSCSEILPLLFYVVFARQMKTLTARVRTMMHEYEDRDPAFLP
jgi:hypothetical protein